MKTRIVLLGFVLQGVASAHEGHAPLPTQGATVRGDHLRLSASTARSIGLVTAQVGLAEVMRTVNAVAAVELPWKQQAFVTSLVAGRIEQVLVKPGEGVMAGQELARLSSMDLENLQLVMLQASSELALATRILERQQTIGEGLAGRILLQTRTEVQQQTARFNVAWQKLRAIGLSDERLQRVRETGETVRTIAIVSPINGVISVADVRAGQFVQPAEHLYHIVDPSRVWVVGKVLEADAGKIKRGRPTQITFSILPGKKFASPIDHVELRLNEDRTLSVKALLDNSTGVLKPGMFGEMEIQIDAEKAVVCPRDALIRKEHSIFCLVRKSAGNYILKLVTVGKLRGQTAEIEDGLFPGDQVVTVGSQELAALFADQPTKPSPPIVNEGFLAPTVAQGQVELPTDQKTFASAPIEGRIRRILVEHGQPVKKGEVLAEIESLSFQTLQLDLLQAITKLKQISVNLERAKQLDKTATIAKKEVWQLQTQHDTYQQAVASSRRKLALLGLSEAEIDLIEQTDLTAKPKELTAVLPIRAAEGLIAEFDLIPGQVVAPRALMFELHNLAKVWVQAFLFEQDAVRVKAGQAVQVRLISDPKFRASGKVDRLNPVLLSGNRALSTWTELDNPGLQLKEGMAAIVTIDTSQNAPSSRN